MSYTRDNKHHRRRSNICCKASKASKGTKKGTNRTRKSHESSHHHHQREGPRAYIHTYIRAGALTTKTRNADHVYVAMRTQDTANIARCAQRKHQSTQDENRRSLDLRQTRKGAEALSRNCSRVRTYFQDSKYSANKVPIQVSFAVRKPAAPCERPVRRA